jgi:hypothetical protein
MTKPSGTDKLDQDVQQPSDSTAKKPYVKPSFQTEQVFETMALSCGKVSSTQAPCHNNQKAS